MIMLYRTVLILQPDNSWLEHEFEKLIPGDTFKLKEPNGTMVKFGQSNIEGTWKVIECHFDSDYPGVDCEEVHFST